MFDSVYRYIQQFINLTQQEFAVIAAYIQVRHFERRVKLTDIGEKENYLNFIHKGLIRKYFLRNNEEVITQIASEKELICSSVSFLTQVASDYVVEAIEPSTVFSISKENLEEIYSLGPKMERMGRLITIDWLLRKEYWENSRIQLEPKERFLKFLSEHPHFLQRVPQKYLASYLNIKPETFSRYKRLVINGELIAQTEKPAI
jgi:CRP-like cAMP-binding protein